MKLKPQNLTVCQKTPLDRPVEGRPHRFYFALTNYCNRACPWCCTYSSPKGKTFLKIDQYLSFFPEDKTFEVQLEGGEPTLHPEFDELVHLAVEEENCTRLIIVTNAVRIGNNKEEIAEFLGKLGPAYTLKVSINHYLLDRDKSLFEKASLLKEQNEVSEQDSEIVLNVRLRRGDYEEEKEILRNLKKYGLESIANVFYLQRYGLASDESEWEEPFIVGENFTLVNPDGRDYGQDLIKRSQEMGGLK
ncbi:MAG: radical SAM protein [Lentisphaeraceae bacterium]|nr:radical SAM protein [Lentisphaeraceae bacterium]